MKGYEKLTESQKMIFRHAHARHLKGMDRHLKNQHQIKNIKAIYWDNEEKCVRIQYDNGKRYRYYLDKITN